MTKISNFKILFLLSVFYFLFSVNAQAATLYFEPQEQMIGTEREFLIGVKIDAEKAVNALSVAVSVSLPLIPFDINEANSIINFWVDKPNFDEASRLLTFSGIIPGGFSGNNGRLLVIKFKTGKENGAALLDFNKGKTKVYLNTPDGIEDKIEFKKISLPIVKGKENIPLIISDSDPPEDFKPEITSNPAIFKGRWFLVFATQDKGSGLDHYEVCEGKRKCVTAESPYLLKNQDLDEEIAVKATDKSGNERIITIPPQKPRAWYKNYRILAILIIVIAYIIWKFLWRKREK